MQDIDGHLRVRSSSSIVVIFSHHVVLLLFCLLGSGIYSKPKSDARWAGGGVGSEGIEGEATALEARVVQLGLHVAQEVGRLQDSVGHLRVRSSSSSSSSIVVIFSHHVVLLLFCLLGSGIYSKPKSDARRASAWEARR